MNKEQERSSGAPAPDALAQTPCPREEELFRKGAAARRGPHRRLLSMGRVATLPHQPIDRLRALVWPRESTPPPMRKKGGGAAGAEGHGGALVGANGGQHEP
jgi:hypothetical protein